ncbi:VirB4 family type IV secretion/conjugal transfer ATPase [Neisseria sp. Ec49-e6-T10]|uniref:VirB4 family type IV secretion/conjugal transfer ATPase n=1 Tax=Neisseria sp. Ec49-e6-T10 TaxID=3140744 RepID=UPI003EBFB508
MITPDTSISEFITLSTHVSPHVIKTVGGDYMITWNLGGLPFVGREDWELEHKHNTFNRLLQTLRAPDYTNVAFWVHDVRRRRKIQLPSKFQETFNQELNDDYFHLLSSQNIMQNELYLTMIYRPVVSGKRFAEKSSNIDILKEQQESAISQITDLASNVEAVLHDYSPYRMGMYEASNGIVFSETLEFFSYLINRADEPVPVLKAPVYEYLATSRHMFGTKTGDYVIRTSNGADHYGAMLNIKEYPDATFPGILNGLKYLNFEYVITHSFSPIGKQDAIRTLDRTKNMMVSSGDKSYTQIGELDVAMDQVSSGNFVLGSYHLTMAIYGNTHAELMANLPLARAELSNSGFVSAKEDIAIAASFYAQLPGNWKYRTRMANVSSLNFLGLSPLHNFSGGKRKYNPWGDAITVLQTLNGQPYYFNFHATHPGENSLGEKAIGNTMVIGKSGTGKTALINFLLSQVQKYDPKPTIFFFDKDRGAEIFVRACGGRYMALDNGMPTGFNPLQCENTQANVQFLSDLIKLLGAKKEYSPSEEEDILRAVRAMLDTPVHLRRLSNLRTSLPNQGDDSLYARLRKWTGDGALAWVFDNPEDKINFEGANIIGFDYTDIIDNDQVRTPVINYLIHRLEELIDGRPLIYVMDEFWKILDGEGGLKDFAKNKQKTIRKQNGLGIFATQSPEDALKSDISAALIEQTATLVLLPNPNADRKDYVDGLKLTQAEYEVVTNLDERSRCFLVKQGHFSAVCQLNLRGLNDGLAVISASTDNIEILHEILAKYPEDVHPDTWLPEFQANRKGMGKNAPPTALGQEGLAN